MIRAILLSANMIVLATPAAVHARETVSSVDRVTAANRAALREPSRDGYINAVQIYPYSEGALYRLYAAPERVTDIMLQVGEAIVSVAAGDTARWTVGDTTRGADETKRVHILVKPFAAGLSTNLVITTDRRAYHLQLESTSGTAMAALSWTYPQDRLIALRAQNQQAAASGPAASGLDVERLNFRYKIEGDAAPWRPLRAFDDGAQVFIQFPAGIGQGEMPPLFILGAANGAELVNYRVRDATMVVDRLFAAAELRLGADPQIRVRIVRDDAAAPPARRGAR